jgi:trimeric autotransporter adhesin
MSQINVNTIVPFNFDTVSVNGAQISLIQANYSLRISNIQVNILGTFNTVLGSGSGGGVTGTHNTILGAASGSQITTGGSNTILGAQSCNNLVGSGNTALGRNTLGGATSASGNVAVGSGAGFNVTTATNSVFIGNGTGQGVSNISGDNIVCIGAAATPSTANAFGEITLGGSSIGALRCAVTSITSLSDARDKKDVTDLRAGLDFVKGLRPVEFVWDERDEEGRHDIADFGFIAQDLKAAQEDAELADVLKLVYESNPEKLEASYGKLVPILVKAVQELAAKFEQLENK